MLRSIKAVPKSPLATIAASFASLDTEVLNLNSCDRANITTIHRLFESTCDSRQGIVTNRTLPTCQSKYNPLRGHLYAIFRKIKQNLGFINHNNRSINA